MTFKLIFIPLVTVISTGALTSCVSIFSRSPIEQLNKSDLNKEVFLRLVPAEGRTEKTRFYSATHTKTFEKNQITHEKQEVIEFVVQTKNLGKDATTGGVKQQMQVLEKDGFIDLHDLAFPELGEELDTLFTLDGRVLKAGSYPRDSIFYVAPISLPNRAVKVGDTWTMTQNWVSTPSGVPMKIDLMTILKSLYRCPNNQLCADLEVSGEVKFLQTVEGMSFVGDIRGRILFSVGTGTVIWGLVRNTERLVNGENEVRVESCIVSGLAVPEAESWKSLLKPRCTPNESSGADAIPGVKSL